MPLVIDVSHLILIKNMYFNKNFHLNNNYHEFSLAGPYAGMPKPEKKQRGAFDSGTDFSVL